MTPPFRIPDDFIDRRNQRLKPTLEEDYSYLARQLERRGIDIEALTREVMELEIAVPSWGVGTGGTRFARFAGPGEPRNVFEKLDDAATVQSLVRCTPAVSLHIPWDEPEDATALREHAAALGLRFDAVNSNTFQDQEGQAHSYKFGSLTHVDRAVREQAIEHNLHTIEVGRALGSTSITVWVGDGGNFPGQVSFRGALERYLESLQAIYGGLPEGWKMYLEHKLYEPAFYSTVNNDWGTSYWCASQLGPKCSCLVDLGHHAPNTNIEMIVSRLLQFGKLGGFHFNDSKYGDDDLDAGAIQPFRLFLIFHELVSEARRNPMFEAAYMLDQSHNVTDPIESLMTSAIEVQRAFAQAWLVSARKLEEYQSKNDALMAHAELKLAYQTDVTPILTMARMRRGGAIDPVATYRASKYRILKSTERPQTRSESAGIV